MTSGWSPDFLQATAAGTPAGGWQQRDGQQEAPSQQKDQQRDLHQVEKSLLSLRQQEQQIEVMLHQLSQHSCVQSSQQQVVPLTSRQMSVFLPPSSVRPPHVPSSNQLAAPPLVAGLHGTPQPERRTTSQDLSGTHVPPQFRGPSFFPSSSSSLHITGKEDPGFLLLHPPPPLQSRPQGSGLLLATSAATTVPPPLGSLEQDSHGRSTGGSGLPISPQGQLLPGFSSSSLNREGAADNPVGATGQTFSLPEPLGSPSCALVRPPGFPGATGFPVFPPPGDGVLPTATLASSHVLQPGLTTAPHPDHSGPFQPLQLPVDPSSPPLYPRPVGDPFAGWGGNPLSGLADENLFFSTQQIDRKRNELLQERERLRQLQRHQEKLLKELVIQQQSQQQQALLQLKPPEGLHCGPAGKQALRQFFEQAYMLSRPPPSLLPTEGANASPTSVASSSTPTSSLLPSVDHQPPVLPISPPLLASADPSSRPPPPSVPGPTRPGLSSPAPSPLQHSCPSADPSSRTPGGLGDVTSPAPLIPPPFPYSSSALGDGSGGGFSQNPFPLGAGAGGEANGESPHMSSSAANQQGYPSSLPHPFHAQASLTGPSPLPTSLPPSASITALRGVGGGGAGGGGSGAGGFSSPLPVLSNVSPALVVCKRWQATQGLQDPRAEALVSLLRAMGVKRNVTYRGVFETTLRPKLILRIMKLRGILRRYLEDDGRRTLASSSGIDGGCGQGLSPSLSPGEVKGVDLGLLRAAVLPHLEDNAEAVWREWLEEQSILKGGGGDSPQVNQGERGISASLSTGDGAGGRRGGSLTTAPGLSSTGIGSSGSRTTSGGKKRREGGRGAGSAVGSGEELSGLDSSNTSASLFSPEEGDAGGDDDDEQASDVKKRSRRLNTTGSGQFDFLLGRKRKKKKTDAGASDSGVSSSKTRPSRGCSSKDFSSDYRRVMMMTMMTTATAAAAALGHSPHQQFCQEVYGVVHMLYSSIQRLGPMFQVRPLQPVLAAVLEAIQPLPIPPSVRRLLLSDTPASRDFYKIAHIRTKHFVWLRQPWRFFAEVSPHLDACVDILKASFLPPDFSSDPCKNSPSSFSSGRMRGLGRGSMMGKRGGDGETAGHDSLGTHGGGSRSYLGGAGLSYSFSSGSSTSTSSFSVSNPTTTATSCSPRLRAQTETGHKGPFSSPETPPPPPGVLLQQEIGILLNYVAGNLDMYGLLVFFIRLKFIQSLLPPGRYAIDLKSSSSSCAPSWNPLGSTSNSNTSCSRSRRASFLLSQAAPSPPPPVSSPSSAATPGSSSSSEVPSSTTGGGWPSGGVEKGWSVGSGGRSNALTQFIPILPVESVSSDRSSGVASVSETTIPLVSRNSPYFYGYKNSPSFSASSRKTSQPHVAARSCSSSRLEEDVSSSSSSSSSSSAAPPAPPSAASAPATFVSETWNQGRSQHARGGTGSKIVRGPSDGFDEGKPLQASALEKDASSSSLSSWSLAGVTVPTGTCSPTGESSAQLVGEKKAKEKVLVGGGGFSKRFGEGEEGERLGKVDSRHVSSCSSGLSSSELSGANSGTREGDLRGARSGMVWTPPGQERGELGEQSGENGEEEEEDVGVAPPGRKASRRSLPKVVGFPRSHSTALAEGSGRDGACTDEAQLQQQGDGGGTMTTAFLGSPENVDHNKGGGTGGGGGGGGERGGDVEDGNEVEERRKRKKAIEGAYDSSRVWPQAECYWGYLRCLLAVAYRDRFNCDDLEMKTVDACWSLILLVNEVIRTGTNSLESARRRDELLSRPLPPSSSSCAAKSSAAAPQTLGGSGGGGGPSWNGSSGPSSDSSSSVCSSGSGGTTTATSAALEISCGASTSSSASADKGGTGFHVKSSNDLLDVCIICMHPVFLQAVAESLALSFYRPDFHPLIFRNQERIWRAFAVLGLSAPYVGLTKYLLESRPSGSPPTTVYPSLPLPSSSFSSAASPTSSASSADVSAIPAAPLTTRGPSVSTAGSWGPGGGSSSDKPAGSHHQAFPPAGVKKDEGSACTSSSSRGGVGTLKGAPLNLRSSFSTETEKPSSLGNADLSSSIEVEQTRLSESDAACCTGTILTPSSLPSSTNPPSCSPFRLPVTAVGGGAADGAKKSSLSLRTSERRVTPAVGFPPCPPAGAVCTPVTGASGWSQRAANQTTESLPLRAAVKRHGVLSSGEISRSNSIPSKAPNEEQQQQQQQHQRRRKGGGGLDIPLSKLIAYAAGSSVASAGGLGSSGVCTPSVTTATGGGSDPGAHPTHSRDANRISLVRTSQIVSEGAGGGISSPRTSMYWKSLTDLTSTHSFVSAYLPTFHSDLYLQCTENLQAFFDLSRDLAAVAQVISASSLDGSCSASAIEAALSAAMSEPLSSLSTVEPNALEKTRGLLSRKTGSSDTPATPSLSFSRPASSFSSGGEGGIFYHDGLDEAVLVDQKHEQLPRHLPRLKEKLKKLARDAVSVCWPPVLSVPAPSSSSSTPPSSLSSASYLKQDGGSSLVPLCEGLPANCQSAPAFSSSRAAGQGDAHLSPSTSLLLPSDCFSAIISALNSVSSASSVPSPSSVSSSSHQHGEPRTGHPHVSAFLVVNDAGRLEERLPGTSPTSSGGGEGEVCSTASAWGKGHGGKGVASQGVSSGGNREDVLVSLPGNPDTLEVKKLKRPTGSCSSSSRIKGTRVEDRSDLSSDAKTEKHQTVAKPHEVKDGSIPAAFTSLRTPSSVTASSSGSSTSLNGATFPGCGRVSSSASFVFPTSKTDRAQPPHSSSFSATPVVATTGGGTGEGSAAGGSGGGSCPSVFSSPATGGMGSGGSSSASSGPPAPHPGGLAAFCARFRAAIQQCGDEGICRRLLVAGRTEIVLARLIITSLLPLTSTTEAFRPLHHSILRGIAQQANALLVLSSATEESSEQARRGISCQDRRVQSASLSKPGEGIPGPASRRPTKEQEGGAPGEAQSAIADPEGPQAGGAGDPPGRSSKRMLAVHREEGGGEAQTNAASSSTSTHSFVPPSALPLDDRKKTAGTAPHHVPQGRCEGDGGGGGRGAAGGGQGGGGGDSGCAFIQKRGPLGDWLFSMSLKCFVRLAGASQGTPHVEESGAVPVSLPESPLTGGGTGGVRERESSLSPGTSLQPSVLLEVTKLLHLLSGLDPLFLQYYLELLKAPPVARTLGPRGLEFLKHALKLGAQYASKMTDARPPVNILMFNRSFEEASRLYRPLDVISGDNARRAGGAGGFLSTGELVRGEAGGKAMIAPSAANSVSSRIPSRSGE